MLQNAETVKLVGPHWNSDSSHTNVETADATKLPVQIAAEGAQSWRSIAVTALAVGDVLFVQRLQGGRHMGTAVQESLNEV
jgi:3-dehydroquinate synthase class II